MMKRKASILLAMITGIVLCQNAFAGAVSDTAVTAETFRSKYTDEQLYDLALEGTLVQDESTKVSVERSVQNDLQITTVYIQEIQERKSLKNGSIQESYKTTAISSISKTEWLSTDMKVTGTVYYDTISLTNGFTGYKITKYSSCVNNYESRYILKKLYQYTAQSGDAYNSSGVRVGFRGENSSFTKTSSLNGTTFSKYTGFGYYFIGAGGSSIGSDITVTYTHNSVTKTFCVSVPIYC